MSINGRDLDNYITGHYGEDQFKDEEPEPDEDDGCVICGLPVKPGERYCGPSCEQEDSGDYPWDEKTEKETSDENELHGTK